MADHGRVSICGSISNYNDTEPQKCRTILKVFFLYNSTWFWFLVPQINMYILMHQLTIHGFMVSSFKKEFGTALSEMAPLVQKVKETNEE